MSKEHLKFYLAGSFSQRKKMRGLMDQVENEGHEISADWTTHKPVKPYKQNPKMAEKYAVEDMEGASSCDIFCLFPEETGGSMQFTELGAAIVDPGVKRIFVVGPHNTRSMVFFHPRVERVDNLEDVFRLVNEL